MTDRKPRLPSARRLQSPPAGAAFVRSTLSRGSKAWKARFVDDDPEITKSRIGTTLLGRFFGKYRSVAFSSKAIELYAAAGRDSSLPLANVIDFPTAINHLWSSELHLNTAQGDLRIGWLRKDECRRILPSVHKQAKVYIEHRIREAKRLFEQLAVEQYLRDSSVPVLEKSLHDIFIAFDKSQQLWREQIKAELLAWIVEVGNFIPLADHVHELRKRFEETTLTKRKGFYDQVESNPLTEEQRLAVIRDNDLNMVLAAAGTGKTSVMVAKALDLIASGRRKPSEILLLAYNNAAAAELRERMALRAKSTSVDEEALPTIMTFHALGRRILKDTGIPTRTSVFAEDPKKLKIWLTQWLTAYVKSCPSNLKKFIQLSYQPANPFDFKTKAEYEAYVRDNEYRTLQAERVRGYQEWLIANWLYMNGIDYEYEAPYVSKRRIETGFDYRPDFHIQDTSIYIEHFGVDRNGKTRPDIDAHDYRQKMESKRQLHREMQTTLLETFHYEWCEKTLETKLEQKLLAVAVKTNPRGEDEIFDKLKEAGALDEAVVRYLKCLQAVRTERLDLAAMQSRLQDGGIQHYEEYAELIQAIHDAYKSELVEQECIDFDDMIIRAIDQLLADQFTPPWKSILVDEFQDISAARMQFLQAIRSKCDAPTMTVVGDDWQSIYRFSGGKLEYTTRFKELVGSCTTTKLQKTFRYNNSIAKVAGDFVMVNPEQYEKQVQTHDVVDTSQVYLLDSTVDGKSNLEHRVAQVVHKIRTADADGEIAVLARYNYLLANAKAELENSGLSGKVKYWTFHGSKGLEADYCVLIGLFQGKSGFPNENHEEALIEALLPSLDGFPHSEERRLFYVGITRARNKSYLIADPMAPSAFINELISPKYDVHLGSDRFREKYRKIFKCPACEHGYFKGYQGQYGLFYKCSSGIACRSQPRVCKKCNSPSVDTLTKSVCNNSDCREEFKICTKCARPMRMREGPFGLFWGCSGFGLPSDRCKATERYAGA